MRYLGALILVFLTFLLCFEEVHAQLSPEAQVKILDRKIISEIKSGNASKVETLIGEYKALGVPVPETYHFIEAKIAESNQDFFKAKTSLEQYFNSTNGSHSLYTEALGVYETVSDEIVQIQEREEVLRKQEIARAEEEAAKLFKIQEEERLVREKIEYDEAISFRNEMSVELKNDRTRKKALADQVGKTLWKRSKPEKSSPLEDLTVLRDGTIIVASSNGLYSLDASGKEIWRDTGKYKHYYTAVEATVDGGFLASRAETSEYRLQKFDARGKKKWSFKDKSNSKYQEYVWDIIETPSSGAIFVGTTLDRNGKNRVFYVYGLDAEGDRRWRRSIYCYNGSSSTASTAQLVALDDGNVALITEGCRTTDQIEIFSVQSGRSKTYRYSPRTVGFFINSDGVLIERVRSTMLIQKEYVEGGKTFPAVTKSVVANNILDKNFNSIDLVRQNASPLKGRITYINGDGGLLVSEHRIQRLNGNGMVIWEKSLNDITEAEYLGSFSPAFTKDNHGIVVKKNSDIVAIENLGLAEYGN